MLQGEGITLRPGRQDRHQRRHHLLPLRIRPRRARSRSSKRCSPPARTRPDRQRPRKANRLQPLQASLQMPTTITAQNGAVIEQTTNDHRRAAAAACCPTARQAHQGAAARQSPQGLPQEVQARQAQARRLRKGRPARSTPPRPKKKTAHKAKIHLQTPRIGRPLRARESCALRPRSRAPTPELDLGRHETGWSPKVGVCKTLLKQLPRGASIRRACRREAGRCIVRPDATRRAASRAPPCCAMQALLGSWFRAARAEGHATALSTPSGLALTSRWRTPHHHRPRLSGANPGAGVTRLPDLQADHAVPV